MVRMGVFMVFMFGFGGAVELEIVRTHQIAPS